LQQEAVVHLVKEVLPVDVYDVLIALVDVLMRLLHGLVGIAVGAEAL